MRHEIRQNAEKTYRAETGRGNGMTYMGIFNNDNELRGRDGKLPDTPFRTAMAVVVAVLGLGSIAYFVVLFLYAIFHGF